MTNLVRYGIFFNPNSGSGESQDIMERAAERLKEKGIVPVSIAGEDAEDGLLKIKESIDSLDALIVIGGDGSLNIAGTAFLQSKKTIPIGVIPGGTINNFARSWGIPLDEDEAIATILGDHTTTAGIGELTDNDGLVRAIISSLLVGRLADISNEVRQSEKRKYGLLVYPYKAIKSIGRQKSHLISFKTDNETLSLKTWIAVVTTNKTVGGHTYLEENRDAFHVTILHNMRLSKWFSYIYFALTGRLNQSRANTFFDTQTLDLINEDTREIAVRIDGDKGPTLPVSLQWYSHYLTLFTPAPKPSDKGNSH